MTDPHPNLLTRDDTFLGVCEGLGQDFGIDPLWLRVGFALALFFQPAMVVAAYLLLGLALAAARWLFPEPVVRGDGVLALRGDNDADAPALREAA